MSRYRGFVDGRWLRARSEAKDARMNQETERRSLRLAGTMAARANRPITDNPWQLGSEAARLWDEGYAAGLARERYES